jgi:CBS domain-containing protein
MRSNRETKLREGGVRQMKVSEVMTTEVETVQLDSTLEEVASIMKVEDVGAVPVVDEDDDLVGIITDRDIVVRCVADGKDPAETNVEDILSHELETIEPDVDIEEAARLMADKQIRRLPVCEDGELVGMLSIGDLAVKTPRIDASAAALREISNGVKGQDESAAVPTARRRRMSEDAHEGGSKAPHVAPARLADDEDLDLEFSDEKDVRLSNAQERHANRHHVGAKGTKQSSVGQSKTQPISPGQPPSQPGTRPQKRAQGITTRPPEEDKRQKRVVSIREDAQAGRPRTSKTG